MADPETNLIPPRVTLRVRSAPKIRQVYWCDFPKDAQLPEFWKTRPVLIFSKTSRLYGSVTVLPFSTKAQPDNPMAYPLKSPIDNQQAWVICDHLQTFSVSRLSPSGKVIPRISQDDFNSIVERAFKGLPRPDH